MAGRLTTHLVTVCAAVPLAAAPTMAPAQDSAVAALADQLSLCVEAVQKRDVTVFDGFEPVYASDAERDGLMEVRRTYEPETGASEIGFAIGGLYFADETVPGADCRVWARPDDAMAAETIAAFRAALADRFGPFTAYGDGGEDGIDEVACVEGRPFRVIVDAEDSMAGLRQYVAIWDSTREGITC